MAAHGGGVAGLHQNGDSGLAFERKMIRKRERDKLNRSRAWRRATARRRPGAVARRVCGTLARNLARDRDRPREKKRHGEVPYSRAKHRGRVVAEEWQRRGYSAVVPSSGSTPMADARLG